MAKFNIEVNYGHQNNDRQNNNKLNALLSIKALGTVCCYADSSKIALHAECCYAE
jgi:hypothetical protein